MLAITPVTDSGLGNTSWLVELEDGSALAVDPSRDPRPWFRLTEKRDLMLRAVAETHLHADFVSGARELAFRDSDVRLLSPRDAQLQYDHQPVDPGSEIDLGGLRLEVLGSPGHTPEHVAYLLSDGNEPLALFSGGTLTVGGVARPDLISPEQTERLARQAWRSITETFYALPDELVVYPTHGAGSFCSTTGGGGNSTTIGQERLTNSLLQAEDEDGFVAMLLGSLGSFPPYFLKLRDVNRAGPRIYGEATPPLGALTVSEVSEQMANGAELIDVRPIRDFGRQHIPGALSIELRDQFASWLGWLVEDLDTPLVFVVGPDQDHEDLVRQCLKIGYENLVGVLAGGVDAWAGAGLETTSLHLTDDTVEDARIVDVRQESEYESGHVPDAVNIELGDIAGSNDLPPGPLVVHCGHGQRAATAASLLLRSGRTDVSVFLGGWKDWLSRAG